MIATAFVSGASCAALIAAANYGASGPWKTIWSALFLVAGLWTLGLYHRQNP